MKVGLGLSVVVRFDLASRQAREQVRASERLATNNSQQNRQGIRRWTLVGRLRVISYSILISVTVQVY